jgi:hypothetical protein
MTFHFTRLLRTPSSERFALRREGSDFAVLELHYLPDGTVQATLIVFEGSWVRESDVPELLCEIDEVLLPEVQLDKRNLAFTVVFGRVLGAFAAEPVEPPREGTAEDK